MSVIQKLPTFVVLASVAALLFSGSTTMAAEEIKIAGGTGPVKNVLLPIKDSFEKSTGIKLIIMELGGTAAFKEMAKGNQEVGSAGFTYDELFDELQKEGTALPDKAAFVPVVIGKAEIKVLVNKDNPVAKLSKEQLKGIFTGKIQNWKEVGGNDAPILITLAKLNPATNATFRKQMLDGESFTREIAETTTADEVNQFITGSAEAIGFGPASLANGSVKVVDAPQIERVMTFITKGPPSAKVQKLYDYIKGDGQKLIKK